MAVPCGVEIGIADGTDRQRKDDLVDLRADADVRNRRAARDELGGLHLEAGLLRRRGEIARALEQSRRSRPPLVLASSAARSTNQIVAHASHYLSKLGHVRILLLRDGDEDPAARHAERRAHGPFRQLEGLRRRPRATGRGHRSDRRAGRVPVSCTWKPRSLAMRSRSAAVFICASSALAVLLGLLLRLLPLQLIFDLGPHLGQRRGSPLRADRRP